MGDELGDMYEMLWQECALLNLRWNEYVELFGKSPHRIDLLNEVAANFAWLMQDTLWETVLLHLCRMTDPPNQGRGRDNLSLGQLLPLVRADLRDEVQRLASVATDATSFARDWRNRRIAHKDLGLATKRANRLEQASHLAVRMGVEAIGSCLNAIDHAYRDTTTAWSMADGVHGAESLLYYLESGVRAEKVREERFQNGTYTAEDINYKSSI